MGVVLRVHSVRGEPRIQSNARGEVAKPAYSKCEIIQLQREKSTAKSYAGVSNMRPEGRSWPANRGHFVRPSMSSGNFQTIYIDFI